MRASGAHDNREIVLTEPSGEYEEAHFVGMEIIWGKGFMSPGGDEEVASVIDGVEVLGKKILDLGCGVGGPAVALVTNHMAGQVVAIDVQREQVERATKLSEDRGVADRCCTP